MMSGSHKEFLQLKLPSLASSEDYGDGGESNISGSNVSNWNKREKYIWFFTLLLGTTALYASRTTMPLVAPAASASMKWSKTEVGTVLSSFFWGYTLTQVLGGYLSDRLGAERVLLAAGLVWGLLTFWFHRLVYLVPDHDAALKVVVVSRVLLGAAQGVHFPALASISSRNLNTRDRSFFFSATTSGGAIGTLVTGTVGSYMNETFGWPSVFYTIGFLSLLWVGMLKYYAMEVAKQRKNVLGMSATAPLLSNASPNASEAKVPWLTYLKSPALWACVFCHFCQNNCFFILLSWLPTYFHDNFPEAKSWIFNVVPWLLMIPGIGVAGYVSNRLTTKGYTVGTTRKLVEFMCMGTEAVCLILIGWAGSSFIKALLLMTACLFFAGFHNSACLVNPQDLSPRHAGSVFGVMNAAGAIPGFIGVYLAGYILELTGSWSAVFNVTAVINFCGIAVFAMFGSGTPIVV